MAPHSTARTVSLLGVPFQAVTEQGTCEEILKGLQEGRGGLVSLANGAYGAIGAGTLLLFLFAPIISSLWKRRFSEGSKNDDLIRFGIPVLIALHGIDAMMNSAFLLPVLYLYGAWVSTEQTPC